MAFVNTDTVESCVLRSEIFHAYEIDLSECVLSACNSGYQSSVTEFPQSIGLASEACYQWSASVPSAG